MARACEVATTAFVLRAVDAPVASYSAFAATVARVGTQYARSVLLMRPPVESPCFGVANCPVGVGYWCGGFVAEFGGCRA